MTMVANGRSLAAIQQYVDGQYGAQQAYRTPTPLPPLGYVPPAR